jgi:hypothetical protein
MELDLKQRAMLRVGLAAAFMDYAGLRQFIRDCCGFDLNQHTDAGQGLQIAYCVAIDIALATGRIDHLLKGCVDHTNPELTSVAGLLQQQLAKTRPLFFGHLQQDPFSALFLGEEECFIGREGLRIALREMQSDRGRRRVLVVNGSLTCGKTYTYGLLRLLDRLGNGNVVVKIDFREFREGDLESRYWDIVEKINTRMGVPAEDMPKMHESQTRWFQNAIRKFEVVARDTGKKLWLVFDHFGVSDVEDKIADALASTAIYTIDEALALHVILIDVDPARLKLEVPMLRKLRNDAAALPAQNDLVTFLKQARDMSGKNGVSDAEIEQAATGIMDSLLAYSEAERAYEFSQLTWKSAVQLGFVP